MSRKSAQKNSFNPSSAFIIFIVVIVGIILFLVGQMLLVYPYRSEVDTASAKPLQDLHYGNYAFKPVRIGSYMYTIYIADTEEKRVKGLSGAKILHPRDGLAFVFKRPNKHSFWMKDMHFSLDFVYIENGIVVDIIENVSPDTYPDTIEPKVPASIVIELNAGQVSENGLKIGDPIDL